MGCESIHNGLHGISVAEQAKPDLLSNRCQKNEACGIAYWGSAAGTARDNVCNNNVGYGISVIEQAKPQLENNRCKQNGEVPTYTEGEGCIMVFFLILLILCFLGCR